MSGGKRRADSGKRMTTFEKKGAYRIQVPDGWVVDEEDDPPAIYHPEGAGAMYLTAQSPKPLKEGDRIDPFLMLRAILNQTSAVEVRKKKARIYSARGLDWAAFEYGKDDPDEGSVCCRAWMATNHESFVYVTYACREEDRDRERETVDSIVGSLEVM